MRDFFSIAQEPEGVKRWKSSNGMDGVHGSMRGNCITRSLMGCMIQYGLHFSQKDTSKRSSGGWWNILWALAVDGCL
jgi:hypothetical protein